MAGGDKGREYSRPAPQPKAPDLRASPARRPANSTAPSATLAGNQSVQSALQPPPFTPVAYEPKPVTVVFEQDRPWLFSVAGEASPVDIAYEVYGGELSMFLEKRATWVAGEGFSFAKADRYVAAPELLVPKYRSQFHAAMGRILRKDIARVESILFETRIDADDEDTLVFYVRWWSGCKDMRDESGRSYFDRFIGRLKSDQWYRHYGLWKGESHPFLDLLYTEVEERKGEVVGLIARNSLEYGGYRPTWATVEVGGAPKQGGVTFSVNQPLVAQTADMVLEGLSGRTSSDDSKIIVDALTGLPPPEQAAVLKNIMARYDERNWIGLGRYGEAWDVGMLYWLFEDLTEKDRERLAKAFKESKVMPESMVNALAAGRGWGGKYLPFTTRKAQEAAMYWADVANKSSGAKKAGAMVAGCFASLWLPETAGTTATTLITAGAMTPQTGAFAVFGRAFPRLATGLGVAGVGLTSFEITLAVQDVITGKDSWTGRDLQSEEILARILVATSGLLMLGATALEIRGQIPKPGSPPTTRVGGTRIMTPDELARLNQTGVWIKIKGQGGQAIEVWVPNGSHAAEVAQQAGLIKSAGAMTPTTKVPLAAPRIPEATPGALAPAGRAPPGQWQPLSKPPSLGMGAPVARLPLPPRPIRMLTPGTQVGSRLSNESLKQLEALYGKPVADATRAANSLRDIETIAQGLGGRSSQYKGTLGELIKADKVDFGGDYALRAHGRSNEPGPDVPSVTAKGPPKISLGEVKLSSGKAPYRIGESGMPKLYGDPQGVHDYIWGVIRNPQVPRVVRARFKLALDEGNIEWQMTRIGNVKIKLRGSDQFPGDVVLDTPIVIPK